MGNEINGSVGAHITLAPEDPNNALVTLNVRKLVHGESGRDEHMLAIAATLFRWLFKPGFSHHSLSADNICILAEVPLEMLRDEWAKIVEEHPNSGGEFRIEVGDAPLPINFPVVVDKDEEG